jgi:hypothetical protein
MQVGWKEGWKVREGDKEEMEERRKIGRNSHTRFVQISSIRDILSTTANFETQQLNIKNKPLSYQRALH